MITQPNDPIYGNEAFNGLSKREYFAAMAMQGSASKAMNYEELRNMANDSVWAADCLIHALNQPNNTEK